MELDLLSMVAGAVASKAGGDVTGAATAPVHAVGEHWKQQVLARLQRHHEKIDQRRTGPVEAPDSIRVKAGVEAALRDDDITHEYLAGVVAGASDDSPTSIVSMIGRLSSLDLRLHCLLYGMLHRLVSDSGALVDDIRVDYLVGRELETYFDLDLLSRALEIGDGPDASRRLLAERSRARTSLPHTVSDSRSGAIPLQLPASSSVAPRNSRPGCPVSGSSRGPESSSFGPASQA